MSGSFTYEIGNRKQCLKLYWIFKQLKNSKTTSEGVKHEQEWMTGC